MDPNRQRLGRHASRHDFDDNYTDENNLTRSHSVGNPNSALPSQIFDNKDYEGGQGRARSLSKNPNSFSEKLKAA